VNIVPIVVVDYSLSNLTFDENKCIHTLKEGAPNVYKDVIEALMGGYKNLSSFMMGYGIGAKTIPIRLFFSHWRYLQSNFHSSKSL